MIAMTVIGWIAAFAVSFLLVRARRRNAVLVADIVQITESLAKMREERDALAATVRYTPLTRREVAALAKGGCAHCHGAGEARGNICKCVTKRMSADARYACFPDGTPARLMSGDERAAADAPRGAAC